MEFLYQMLCRLLKCECMCVYNGSESCSSEVQQWETWKSDNGE